MIPTFHLKNMLQSGVSPHLYILSDIKIELLHYKNLHHSNDESNLQTQFTHTYYL